MYSNNYTCMYDFMVYISHDLSAMFLRQSRMCCGCNKDDNVFRQIYRCSCSYMYKYYNIKSL